jgi:tetratricopeptide (TPR) repeat protein
MPLPWFILVGIALLYAKKNGRNTGIRFSAILGMGVGLTLVLIRNLTVETSEMAFGILEAISFALKSGIAFATLCMLLESAAHLTGYLRRKSSYTPPSSPENAPLTNYASLEAGKRLFLTKQFNEALASLDTAEQSGLSNAELFGIRGTCLQTLGWHLDAIDDYTRAIELEPSDCNTYFQRAMSKSAVGDNEGFHADINAAIALSKIDSPLNRTYNQQARESGHTCVADVYEWEVKFSAHEPDFVSERLANEARQKGRRSKPLAN